MSWQKTNFKFKDSSFWLKILVPLFLLYYFLYELIHKNQLRFSGLDIPITTRCNLYCDNCANLMNYYKGESINLHLSLDELIEEIDLLFETVDYVFSLKILGGEPFLNNDLAPFLEYLANCDFSEKFDHIVILTNGTVIPKENILNNLHNDKIMVGISNYGKKSERIIPILNQYGINYELSSYDEEWFDMGDMSSRNRSEINLINLFNSCLPKVSCNSYFKKQFHLCPRSAHGVDLGFVPEKSGDFVYFDKSESISIRRKKLKELRNKKYICACDYCDWPLERVIKKRGEV